VVREHCRDNDITYTETSLAHALTIVVRYLNEVGLAGSRTFRCSASAAMERP
jgi:hypothetical protein